MMSKNPPLTRDIGQTERMLQALLHQQLLKAQISFPKWIVLTFLSNGHGLSDAELVAKLDQSKIAGASEAGDLVASMIAAGLIARDDGLLSISEKGVDLFQPLREAVERITQDLFADLPPDDLEVTRRTLATVANRANELLSAGSAQA